jgi:hypothetical protein
LRHGGFLLAAHEWIVDRYIAEMDADDKRFLRDNAVHGWEIVDGTARLCAMNLLLHGIGTATGNSLRDVSLMRCAATPGLRVDVIAANPPFGRKSSMTMVNEAGEAERDDLVVVRDDFWASTSNKQLNFLQHIKTMLKIGGRAAVVLPDNVLFEAGAGETIRRGDCWPSARFTRSCVCRRASSTPGREGQRRVLRPQASRPTPGRRRRGSTTCAPTSTSRSRPTNCGKRTSPSSSRATARTDRSKRIE